MNDVWAFLEVYKEFIINGLDLISFTLVTPELFRTISGAAARRGFVVAIVMVFLVGFAFAGVYL